MTARDPSRDPRAHPLWRFLTGRGWPRPAAPDRDREASPATPPVAASDYLTIPPYLRRGED